MKIEIEISAETEARLREMAVKWASSGSFAERLAQTLGVEAQLHLARGVREAYQDFKRHEARMARLQAEADQIAKDAVESVPTTSKKGATTT